MTNPRKPDSLNGQIRHLLATEASMTAREIEQAIGKPIPHISQRLTQLRRVGHVQVVGIGAANNSGPRQLVYGIESATA